MSSQVDHMEVAPRMWDKSLAAAYSPKVRELEPVQEEHDIVVATSNSTNVEPTGKAVVAASTVSLFTRMKTYLLPAVVVICILILGYVTWTYYTKYRQKKSEETPVIDAGDIPEAEQLKNPALIVASEDTTKYEYDSDEDKPVPFNRSATKNLETIQELSEEDDDVVSIDQFNSEDTPPNLEDEDDDEDEDEEEDEEEEEEDEDEEEDEEDEDYQEDDEEKDDEEEDDEEPEEHDSPDIAEIEQLIKDHRVLQDDEPAILEDNDMFSLTIPSYDDILTQPTQKPAAKKTRKMKRVTL